MICFNVNKQKQMNTNLKKIIFLKRKNKNKNYNFYKFFSGTLMLAFVISSMLLISDPAIFSAQIIDQKKDIDFITYSKKLGGLTAQNSPTTNLINYLALSPEKKTFIFFIKTIKASQKNDTKAQNLYSLFQENLYNLPVKKQEKLLTQIVYYTQNIDIDNPAFKYVLDIFSLLNKEDLLIKKLLVYGYKNKNDYVFKNRTRHLFETISEKQNWKQFIKQKSLISLLKKIKTITLTNDNNANLHAASNWQTQNVIWQHL